LILNYLIDLRYLLLGTRIRVQGTKLIKKYETRKRLRDKFKYRPKNDEHRQNADVLPRTSEWRH
jgi:hypothetical protein